MKGINKALLKAPQLKNYNGNLYKIGNYWKMLSLMDITILIKIPIPWYSFYKLTIEVLTINNIKLKLKSLYKFA